MSRYLDLEYVPVDTRGHRQIHDPGMSGRLRGDRVDATIHTVHDDDPLTDGFASVFGGVFSCATCDAHPSFDVVEHPDGPHGIGLRARTDCVLPNGAETVSVLRVTSGRIIISDDLRPVFDIDLDRSPGYNSAAGQIVYSAAMAALGCVYGPVGSGSVDLIRLGSPQYGTAVTDGGRYALASYDDEAEPGEDGYLDLGAPGPGQGAVLAHVENSLWAYSIADHQVWSERARSLGLDPDELLADRNSNAHVVDFPRGTYLFVHHQSLADADSEGGWWPATYADITMIAPHVPRANRGEQADRSADDATPDTESA